MIPDTSGPTLLVPLAHYDPASSSWKTSQGMFPSDWPTSSETCPRWGMTRGGELFELPMPEHRIAESGSSFLPTPKAGDGERGRDVARPREDMSSWELSTVLAFLPTPTADDRRNAYGTGASRDYQSLANTAVTELLPTPTARDWKDTGNFTPHPEKSKLPHTIASLGASTAPQSIDGPTSSGADLPSQLRLGGEDDAA